MKNLRTAAIPLAAMVVLVLFGALGVRIAHAQSFKSSDSVTLPAGETIDSSLYAAGRTITIAGTVNGDVFCAGQTVTITGTVHGDVLCAGQTLDITGTVDGSVRAAGQTVTFNAEASRNASLAGQTVTLGQNAKVAGDVSAGGQTVVVNGSVGRDLALSGQTSTVNAQVGRDVKAGAEELVFSKSAVARNVDYTSDNKADIANGAKITGSISRHTPAKKDHPKSALNMGFGIVMALFIIASLLFTALVLVLLFPRAFENVSELGLQAPGTTLLIGIAAFIAVPVVCISLLVSVIGIPLAILLGMAWFFVIMLSGPVFAFYIGRLLMSHSTNPLAIMLVGGLPVLVLYFIPFIGQLLLLLAGFMGTGMLLKELWAHWPRPHYHMEHQHASRKADK